jgi:hypothetical protein
LLTTNQDYKEVMVSCSKGTTDYDLAGSKTGGNVLLEAGQLASKNGGVASNVYAQPACQPVTTLQAQDFAQQQQAWVGHRQMGGYRRTTHTCRTFLTGSCRFTEGQQR